MEEDLLDWEIVHGSDTDSVASDKKSESSSVIDNGVILSDHFSCEDPSQNGVVESGDSSPVGSISGHLDVYRSDDVGEVRVSDFEEKQPEIEAVGGIKDASKYLPESEEAIEDSSKSWSDSGGNELVSGDSGFVIGKEEILSGTEESQGSEGKIVNSGEESKSRETVWWKMPFVLLKYSAFRIGPVWSVSIAAAVMGFILLGRRLYNMKKKAQSFNLKVTVDEKKVSQVMSQAAQLNEVFTEVRRVPVIRSALPSPGTWPPVLSLR